jgi:PEP-CTERM motif
MRMTRLAALVASAFFATGAAQAGLVLDLDGVGGIAAIEVDALDWSPTSVLAKNANTAALAREAGLCVVDPTPCLFEVLTHAKLTGITPTATGDPDSLPGGFVGEVTMVTRFGMLMTSDVPGAIEFATTGEGWIEFYYGTENSNTLTGSNFNDGRLIGRLLGTSGLTDPFATGGFTVTSDASEALDQAGTNQYPGQFTLPGTGSMTVLRFGSLGVALDPTFFKTTIAGFDIDFENISIGLPNKTANPSDCYNLDMAAAAVGTAGLSTQCNTTHALGPFSGQEALLPGEGYLPRTGDVNILDNDNPDFVAQTDFNSAVVGVPEPASIALLGLALGGLGYASRRRKVS